MSKATQPPITVAQVSAMVRDALADAIPARLRVVGQVSNLSKRDHWFFSLKDEQAALKCACFASAARKIAFPVENGMEVIATGRIDYYGPQGQLQLYVDRLEPVGHGALELQFRALCEELRNLGYFDAERKKSLPLMPRCVAVVTSRGAAALQDVIDTARRRWAGCRLLLFDVRVQGKDAAGEIARAIGLLSRDGPALGIDAVILTRGGGSMEDLWAFNERIVADTVLQCELPIVAAIGHEVDTTVAELVADVRCATPTQAAMRLIPDKQGLVHQVDQVAHRLGLALKRRHERSVERLAASARHAVFRFPEEMVRSRRERLDALARRLSHTTATRVMRDRESLGRFERVIATIEPRGRLTAGRQQLAQAMHRIQTALRRRATDSATEVSVATANLTRAATLSMANNRKTVETIARQLDGIGPGNVLNRGYSYTLGPGKKVLRHADQVAPGDAITTVLADGRVRSRVESGLPRPAKRRGAGDGEPGLFTNPEDPR